MSAFAPLVGAKRTSIGIMRVHALAHRPFSHRPRDGNVVPSSHCMNDPPTGGSHGKLPRTTKILSNAWQRGGVAARSAGAADRTAAPFDDHQAELALAVPPEGLRHRFACSRDVECLLKISTSTVLRLSRRSSLRTSRSISEKGSEVLTTTLMIRPHTFVAQ
jgi:hypothetical protein